MLEIMLEKLTFTMSLSLKVDQALVHWAIF